MTEYTPPVIGAALLVDDLERHHNWIIESQRDLELQDFDPVSVLEDQSWGPLVEKAKHYLDGYEGRLGIHGPFRDLPLAASDPAVRRIVDLRMNQALDICGELGATAIVVHSPFTIWDYDNFDHFTGARERLMERVHKTMGGVVKRAEQMGVSFVIETIEDKEPRFWTELARSFNSPAVGLSIDTGHTYYCHASHNAPPLDYFIKAAGADLKHMHIQDADGHADRHWRPGKGTINWVAVFEALRDTGANPRLIIELDSPNRHEVRMGADWLIERGLAR